MKQVYNFKEVPESCIQYIGGKGASLVKLTRLKMPVPEGFVIGKDAEPSDVENEIAKLSSGYTYAVRSSALNEDGEDASFAGQYETITDVKKENIQEAVNTVRASANAERVKEYTEKFNADAKKGIGVVVQRFVRPEFAGVIFTADIITGSSNHMSGNYVHGEGEALVSGSSNAFVFTLNIKPYKYNGPEEFRKYARQLFRLCRTIKDNYGCQMDIEWAVSDGKLYILQARPITTLKRINDRTFDINGSFSGEYLFTRTNVGEIFMEPVSPMTYSVLEKINTFLGLPQALDFIKGQAFMNISVICSMQTALGVSEKKAFENIRDLVGNLPDGMKVPVFPFDKKVFLKNLKKILFTKSKLSKKQKSEMVKNISHTAQNMIEKIRKINNNKELLEYWNNEMIPGLKDGLSAVMAECGTRMIPLFTMRNKLTKTAGADMANKLCSGGTGILESMKPLLMLEDIINKKASKEDYMKRCGQRCAGEMELSKPRPYEIKDYMENAIKKHKETGISLYSMKEKQETEYIKAVEEFERLYPAKKKWFRKNIKKFADANIFREDIRSKGVWMFCVLREFLLCAGRINKTGDDVFLLYLDEALSMLKGDESVKEFIRTRKENYNKNFTYPPFPGLICGRFDPDAWMKDENRRYDFYCAGLEADKLSSDVKGFPGAAGIVEGTARVITSIDNIDELLQGEILVTQATNIGWTTAFSRAAAIVTDIGAPLSHAAIVAREFGIPAVVGCQNATTVIKNGDRIIVDGANGKVKIV